MTPNTIPRDVIQTGLQLRDGLAGMWLWGQSVSSLGKPHSRASGRRQWSRGAGGRLRNAGQRSEQALSTPMRGGQRNRPRAGAVALRALVHPHLDTTSYTNPRPMRPQKLGFLSAQKSCRTLVRKACRTRGGLAVFGLDSDMRRRGELRPKIDKPRPLRGRDAKRLGGGVKRISNQLRNQIAAAIK